ncbi:MAG: hypothetical protein FWD52_04415 [Candidatus Bathyarchaeota archaeon]|nr:hypothetical protein [Candidatus Termiticorpusculum sp.]
MGNLLAIKVHAVNIADTMGGCHVYQAVKNKFSSIRGGCGDAGYRGTFASFVRVKYGELVDISEGILAKAWQVLPKRWCVERTFAWANWSRILSKGYEIKSVYEENDFMISHLHTLLKRY